MTEPQRCIRGERCEAAEPADPKDPKSTKVGAPADKPLCQTCEFELPDLLEEAPNTYRELLLASLVHGSGEPGPKRKITGSPLGFTGAPYHLAEQLHWWVTAWADVVIYTAGRPAPDRERQPVVQQVDDACALLHTYLSAWLAHQPVEFWVTRGDADPEDPKQEPSDAAVFVEQSGVEACAWLLDWRQQTERVLGKRPLIHYPPEPCPACDQAGSLRRRDGTDKVRCVNCRKSWTMEHFEIFVHAWIGGAA